MNDFLLGMWVKAVVFNYKYELMLLLFVLIVVLAGGAPSDSTSG